MACVTWFCEYCGAANNDHQESCFACHQERREKGEEELLLHGRYQLQTQVGIGGFGCVYRAIDTQQHQRIVAIKQINLHGLTAQQKIEATDAFNREISILSTLSHAHLPRIYEHFTDPEHWYLVMDYIPGRTLEQYIEDQQKRKLHSDSNGPMLLSLGEILELALQLCDVLEYLHTRKPAIIFRDLKPANIMRTPYGEFFLIDFGIARLFKPGKVRDTIPFGSPGYAAPEQYGKAQTTPQADIYSLGALLHHLISGEDPAEAPFHFTPSRHYGSTDIQALEALITRMVALKVESRPRNIAEVCTELQNLIWPDTRQTRRVYPPTQPSPISISSPYRQYSAQYSPQQQQQQQMPWTPPPGPPIPSRRSFLQKSLVLGGLLAAGAIGWTSIQSYSTNSHAMFALSSMASLSPDAAYIALADEKTVHILDTTNKKSIVDYPVTDPIQQILWSPNSQVLAIVKTGSSIDLYNLANNSSVSISSGYYINVKVVVWSANSQSIATTQAGSTNIAIWSVSNGKQLFSFESGIGNVTALAWSPDGGKIVVGSDQNTIRAYDSHTGTILSTYGNALDGGGNYGFQSRRGRGRPGHQSITSLDWSPDGQSVASGDDANTLTVWDAQSGQQTFSDPNAGALSQIYWSPSSQYIAAISNDSEVLIWNMTSRQIVSRLPIRAAAYQRTITWSSDSLEVLIADLNGNVSRLKVY